MATKQVLVNLNLNGNEIQNVVLHSLATAPTAYGAGHIYYDSALGRTRWYDGTVWNDIYTINDAGSGTDDLWSASQTQNAINTAVTAGLSYKGGYDTALNSPDLDTAPSGVVTGDMYTATSAGTFFTEQLEIGDVLIAEVDGASTLADWTVVQRNLSTATDTSEGTVELATIAEAQAGTSGALVITASVLNDFISNENVVKKFAVDLDAAEASVVRTFAGGITTFTVTHALGTLDVQTQVREISSGEIVILGEFVKTANTVDICFAGNVADNLYRVVVQG